MAKPAGPKKLKTGDDYIDHAKSAGAIVNDHRGGFKKISTPKGSMYIAPGNQPLDPRTRKNYTHWFKLLGLLSLLLFGWRILVWLDAWLFSLGVRIPL